MQIHKKDVDLIDGYNHCKHSRDKHYNNASSDAIVTSIFRKSPHSNDAYQIQNVQIQGVKMHDSTSTRRHKSINSSNFNRLFTCLFVTFILNFMAFTLEVRAQFTSQIEQETPLTTYISQVLNGLVDPTKYDKRLRPRYGEGPVNVGITLHVSSISAVSEVDMDFTLDFYLRQYWQDPRLAFGKLDLGIAKITELTVGVDYLDKLWKPDTFFPNEKKSFFHLATTHNSFLRIDPDGKVSTSQRLTVTATCPMRLKLFPMDTQECKLEIESYGYTTDDISYFWGKEIATTDPPQKSVAFSKFGLPQFRRSGYRVNKTTAVLSSGAYDRLYVQVVLSRNIGFYLMNIILPAMLIVMISWVSFWLNREASPARVTLGVTTVLTMTTLITTTNNSMPKVSYIKGLDVFLNFCFVMVFASLVEYAVVSYLNKRRSRRQQAKKTKNERQATSEIPMFNYPSTPASALTMPSTQTFAFPSSPNQSNIPPDCDCRAIPLIQYAQLTSDNAYHQPISFLKIKRNKKRKIFCQGLPSPSRIDRCSRIMFPTLFVVFQLIYWSIMQKLSESAVKVDYHEFDDE